MFPFNNNNEISNNKLIFFFFFFHVSFVRRFLIGLKRFGTWKLKDLEIGVFGPRLIVVGFDWTRILVGHFSMMDELIHFIDCRALG